MYARTFDEHPPNVSVQWVSVAPLVLEPQSRATARSRAATVLRVVEEVVLKYSWNLVAEPEAVSIVSTAYTRVRLEELACSGSR